MASVTQLQRQYIEYSKSLYNEGYINDQFMELHKMQVDDPNFVVDLVSMFVQISDKLFDDLKTAFQQKTVDYKKVAFCAHSLKGSSSNLGAQRVTSVCILFLDYCNDKNLDRCLWCLQQAYDEYILYRNKFEALFKLNQQILQAGGSVPMMEI